MVDDMKQERKSHSAQRRARYREIATVLWEERLFDIFRGIGLEDDLPAGMTAKITPGTKEKDLPQSVRIRHALERLGPIFVKIGQLLSTRNDLLHPSLLQELAKLQDDVPNVPWKEMRTCVENELGASIDELFKSFDNEPLASASIGQVYRATLHDDTPVAVKVQRPSVAKTVEIDLDIIHDLAGKLAKHVRWAKENDVVAIAEELASVLRAELNYTLEGRSLDRFRSAFAAEPSLVFPRVYWDHTTSRVLTMDLIEGVPATELENNKKVSDFDRTHLVQLGVVAYFRMIFQFGFYHADPHPGNLFALPGGQLGFVDFGRVATISERNSDASFDMLMAIFDDDPTGATEALLAITGIPSQIDLALIEIDISVLLAQYRRQQFRGENLNKLVRNFLKLMRNHQLQVPPELTVLLITLGVLEGVAIQIDPDFRMIDAAKSFASKFIPERYSPKHIFKTSLRSAQAYGRFFDKLPVYITRALRRIGEGEFKMTVKPDDYEALVDRLTMGIYQLAYAIIVGALIVGFSFIVGGQNLTKPERNGYHLILLTAIASVIWLAIRSLRIEWHKRQNNKRARR